MAAGLSAALDTTIFGARCNAVPPFTPKELRQEYLGCQNLPTALWISKFYDVTDRAPTLSP